MNDTIIGSDLYFRVTDAAGKSYVNYARAWDREKLFASLQQNHGDAKKKPEERCTVTMATREEYLAERRKAT